MVVYKSRVVCLRPMGLLDLVVWNLISCFSQVNYGSLCRYPRVNRPVIEPLRIQAGGGALIVILLTLMFKEKLWPISWRTHSHLDHGIWMRDEEIVPPSPPPKGRGATC
jgi:hypothetical protein